VIGADGMHSTVARAVQAEEYNTKPSLSFAYYAYFSGFPPATCEIHFGEEEGVLSFPTNDALQCVAVGAPTEGFQEFRKDIEGNFMRVIESVPSMAEKMKNAKREERFIGTNDQPNFFRKPYGDGWALVGDAGYHRDFSTGLGIADAFRDCEYLVDAIDEGLAGKRPIDEAMAEYEAKRNEIAEPLYELTTQIAGGEEPPTPQQFIAFGAAMQKMMPEGVSA
jgi:2-polyprenyl-6-methoxyphenol hydroxylase-like FAD-dependent oxidoreductase